jgi:hypothetical protein
MIRPVRRARSRGGLSMGEIAVMTITVGGILLAVTLLFGGKQDVERAASRLLPTRSALPAVAGAESPPKLDAARLAGRWVGDKAHRVIVTTRGEVWSDSGQMEGWVKSELPAGANFAFGDALYECAYDVRFTGENEAQWRLVEGTAGTPCPAGRFERPFSFAN